MSWTEDGAQFFYSFGAADCALSFDAIAGVVGDPVEATFTATLTDVLTYDAVAISGTFRTTVLF